MLKLKHIISQLRENEYEELMARFRATKADKYLTLLVLLRQDVLPDNEIAESLGIGRGAYYTLKSRLHDKIQEFQLSTILGVKESIIKRVDNIPQLLYETPKETAIAVLRKLEEDLTKYDMPWELTKVYSALKKLHLHNNKYYQYSQNYNKQVAYTITIEKIEELAAEFFKYIGNYYVTREESWLEYLVVIKDQVASYCNMYQSHHMLLYKYMVNISFALFIPLPEKTKQDDPVEDMLAKMNAILSGHDNNQLYKYLRRAHALLSFEYYHNMRQSKKADEYFEKINDELPSLLLYNFFSFSGYFFRSKVEHYVSLDMQHKLHEENEKLTQVFSPRVEDMPNYVSYLKYLAISAMYSQKYLDSINILNTLMSTISLRQCAHAEIEIKLFHAYCYCMVNNFESAYVTLRNAMYKIREAKNKDEYENAYFFARMLNILLDRKFTNTMARAISFKKKFQLFNQGTTRMLEYLPLSDEMLILISKEAKKRKVKITR